MKRVVCNNCKNKVEVSPYFYDPKVITESYHYNDTREYTAVVNGKAICPLCGHEIRETFRSTLSASDIINLATRKLDCEVLK